MEKAVPWIPNLVSSGVITITLALIAFFIKGYFDKQNGKVQKNCDRSLKNENDIVALKGVDKVVDTRLTTLENGQDKIFQKVDDIHEVLGQVQVGVAKLNGGRK